MIFVTRSCGRFIVHVMRGQRTLERVTAQSAQLIIDYLNAAWPVGTRVQWIIL